MTRPSSRPRRGALAVEGAIVYSVMFVLLFGLIVGGVAVFRHQQAACLAREAARWASVRGGEWQKDTKRACPTEKEIFDEAVLPFAAGMDPDRIELKVEWIDRATGTAHAWDGASKNPVSLTASKERVANRVRVRVTYHFTPHVFLAGPLVLTSTSELPMSF
jgi:Flp pilus assembly protein TadG